MRELIKSQDYWIELGEVISVVQDKDLAIKGVSALQKALEAKNVKVDPQILHDAVEEAHKAILEECTSCAHGWHW